VCNAGRSARVRRRTHHGSHHIGRQVPPPRRDQRPHVPGIRVRLPSRAVTRGRTQRRPPGRHGGEVTSDTKRIDSTIDLTIDIDPTLDEVWQALTTGEGIARWFAPHAAVTPGEGGSVSVGWDPKEMWETPITVWEPQRRMQTASEMPSKDGRKVRLAVDYYLEVQGGRVRVRLVHSGFDDSSWDDYIDGLDAGWSYFLFNLKHALERHRGVARRQESARFRTTARAG